MQVESITIPAVPAFRLELTMYEAEALLEVAEHIGGCPKTSRRKVFDELNSRLKRLGVTVPRLVEDKRNAGINFRSET